MKPCLYESGQEQVDMLTADEFLEDKETPNLVRMDVEGYEINILKGMKHTLKADVKLFMELHGHLMTHSEIDTLITILTTEGFTVGFAALDHGIWSQQASNPLIKPIMTRLGRHATRLNLTIRNLHKMLNQGACVNVLLAKT